jgi:hypothetical protein
LGYWAESRRNAKARENERTLRAEQALKDKAALRLVEYAKCLDLGNRLTEAHNVHAAHAAALTADRFPLADSGDVRDALVTFEAQRVRVLLVGSFAVKAALEQYDASLVRDTNAARSGVKPPDDGTYEKLTDAMRVDLE